MAPPMKLRSPAGLAAGLLVTALVAATPAAAAPVTVDLRIEGPDSTLFEGPVTTDVRPMQFTGDPATHQCDATTVGGTSPTPVPTRGAALAAAAASTPFSLLGTWDAQFGASFTSIAGVSVAFDPATNRFLGEYENGQFAQVGACADPIAAGDKVLFAYGDGSEILLSLTGPAGVRAGQPFTVRVTDAAGAPVAGAAVGGATTGADGNAAVGPLAAGEHDLKASRTGAIRSNGLHVVATADGTIPSPAGPGGLPLQDVTAPVAGLAGIRSGRTFARGKGPRTLRGSVTADPSGIRAVKLRLSRRLGKACWYFSGSKERFVRRRCGTRHAFKIGDDPSWSYLLPARLGRGRYVLETYAIDRAGNRSETERVVFQVR